MKLVIDIPEDLYEGIERRDGALETEYVCDELMKAVDNSTPLEQEPKTGHWIEDDDPEIINPSPRCSLCGGIAPLHDIGEGAVFNLSDYCPNCGAKMQEAKG